MVKDNGAILSIDVGGTFTDVLWRLPGETTRTCKLRANVPLDMAEIRSRLRLGDAPIKEVQYSTTTTLNGLLTGRLPPIGLIVTAGFLDILETARLPESAGIPPASQLPRRLVALEHVQQISARLNAVGIEVKALDDDELARIIEYFSSADIRVVAVSLLHSYRNPTHESAIKAAFRRSAAHIEVACSADILPEPREYERTLTTALNAALMPILVEQIEQIQGAQTGSPRLSLMQSNGGLVDVEAGMAQPLSTALSGPSAAVVGMCWLAKHGDYENVITLDIGGTSTDVALIEHGEYRYTTERTVAGFPFKIPMLDVLSIGAGGGSIAHEGADNRWIVGPQSAGAVPGPACYGQGGSEPTVTDAHLLLGRLPDSLLGGEIPLDRGAATAAFEQFASRRGLNATDAARGVLEIASHRMCGAIRRVSVARGFDPAQHVIMAMGGAGPLHGAELAELLGIATVVVPPAPGLAAAWGMQTADFLRDFVMPFEYETQDVEHDRLISTLAMLRQRADQWLTQCDVTPSDRLCTFKMDLRYSGMTHPSTVDCPPVESAAEMLAATIERFEHQFEHLTGRSWRDREQIEIVNLRLQARGLKAKPQLGETSPAANQLAQPQGERRVGFLGLQTFEQADIFDRQALSAGDALHGPAIVEQYESTTVVPPGWHAKVDGYGNLILRAEQ